MMPGQGHFSGVIKIVRFNVQFYVLSTLGLLTVLFLVASRRLPLWLEFVVLCGAAVIVFWILSSLFASWYVYDYVGVTRWQWLRNRLPVPPRRWVNIHAGLDESTFALRRLFPQSEGSVVDIYDSGEMTEPSISRARRMNPAREPFKPGNYNSLPLPDDECDVVFLLFSAHEVRIAQHRTELLRETARVLMETGYVVLVEHLRDWKNFLAFGPGFLHFHSKRNWLRNIRSSGLSVEQESHVTPLVQCFVLRKTNQ
jgi:ubiquinone/menaquinone biosynthesis C-methylase UbiE